ncbi:orotidine-5'-phosphate decarboxylase [Patescibacteria group bacterium]
MKTRNFFELLEARWKKGFFMCVGLDSELGKIPKPVRQDRGEFESIFFFNQTIVDVTKDIVCTFKPNIAFYESLGSIGLMALEETIEYIRETAPEIPIILDFKRGDTRNSNQGYLKLAFEKCKVDAVTVHNYLGQESLQDFLDMSDKGIFIICRTSNPDAGEFQDLEFKDERLLYQVIAKRVSTAWNGNGNCGLVVGATCPEEIGIVRNIIGDEMPILIPGVGAQKGDLEKSIDAGLNTKGQGIIINSSSGIIFAHQDLRGNAGLTFDKAIRRSAEKLHGQITGHLNRI